MKLPTSSTWSLWGHEFQTQEEQKEESSVGRCVTWRHDFKVYWSRTRPLCWWSLMYSLCHVSKFLKLQSSSYHLITSDTVSFLPIGSINDAFRDQTAHKTFLLNVLDLELFQPTCIKYFRAGHSLSNIDNAALAHLLKKIFPLLAVPPPSCFRYLYGREN